jgi:hypothetical protein
MSGMGVTTGQTARIAVVMEAGRPLEQRCVAIPPLRTRLVATGGTCVHVGPVMPLAAIDEALAAAKNGTRVWVVVAP